MIGAKIRGEKESVKEWILQWEKKGSEFIECKRDNGERLVIGYSKTRTKKDAYNRGRGVERLRKSYSSGVLAKSQVNKRRYNKFLEISKDVEARISKESVLEDAKWDGLKGYVTYTDFPAEDVVAQYRDLWVVERAFRILKGKLDMRPMFHFTEKKIEVRVCSCFVAYKVHKELERIITKADIQMSVDKVLDIAKTITTIRVKMPQNGEIYTKTLFLKKRQRAIRPLFDLTRLGLE